MPHFKVMSANQTSVQPPPTQILLGQKSLLARLKTRDLPPDTEVALVGKFDGKTYNALLAYFGVKGAPKFTINYEQATLSSDNFRTFKALVISNHLSKRLEGVTLQGNFKVEDFSGFNLTGATFKGNFTDVVFLGTTLTGASFKDAKVKGASFKNTTLNGSELTVTQQMSTTIYQTTPPQPTSGQLRTIPE